MVCVVEDDQGCFGQFPSAGTETVASLNGTGGGVGVAMLRGVALGTVAGGDGQHAAVALVVAAMRCLRKRAEHAGLVGIGLQVQGLDGFQAAGDRDDHAPVIVVELLQGRLGYLVSSVGAAGAGCFEELHFCLEGRQFGGHVVVLVGVGGECSSGGGLGAEELVVQRGGFGPGLAQGLGVGGEGKAAALLDIAFGDDALGPAGGIEELGVRGFAVLLGMFDRGLDVGGVPGEIVARAAVEVDEGGVAGGLGVAELVGELVEESVVGFGAELGADPVGLSVDVGVVVGPLVLVAGGQGGDLGGRGLLGGPGLAVQDGVLERADTLAGLVTAVS